MGVPIYDISYVFGDNESMVNSSKFPYARLHKIHNILSYHYVRSIISWKFISLTHLTSKSNLADIVSKHWGYSSCNRSIGIFDQEGSVVLGGWGHKVGRWTGEWIETGNAVANTSSPVVIKLYTWTGNSTYS